jgi:hypothetical protein
METQLREVTPCPKLAELLSRYEASGGVLDFILLEVKVDGPPEKVHRAAALEGMSAIDRRLEQWAISQSSKEFPISSFFRLRWEEASLTGHPVTFSEFWGTDDAEPKPIGDGAWSIPGVDGYKTAYFQPPYGLRGEADEKVQLFADINSYLLGNAPERAEIFSWSTNWSNYFDAGLEWWGAFFWTIRPAGSRQLVVIGASSTD